MKIAIRHHAIIDLLPGTPRAVHHLLLTPTNTPTQRVLDWSIAMEGFDAACHFLDGYGNPAQLVNQTRIEGPIAVTVTGTVETLPGNGVIGRLAGDPVPALFRRQTDLTPPVPELVERFAAFERMGGGRITLLHELMGHLAQRNRVADPSPDTPAHTQTLGTMTQMQADGVQSQSLDAGEPEDTPAAEDARIVLDASGFASAFIGTALALGIPARYVTGYHAGSDELGAGFHAWAEAWDDALGWIAFDAALSLCPTDRHVRLAGGLDAHTTLPLRSVPVVPMTQEVSIELVS